MEPKLLRKPNWLNKKINLLKNREMKILLKEFKLNTVCQEALCPNISECFFCGVATFMIMGNICTRNCKFCNIKKGKPLSLDWNEPERIKKAVERLKLKYVVITSPTRDDLKDGGAKFYAYTISVLKRISSLKIEVLIPDFLLKRQSLETLVEAKPDVIAHNIETVPSLYKKLRPKADYRRSIKLLRALKEIDSTIITKSGIMLGLGEKEKEIIRVFKDLRGVDCDFVSIGQYLPPSLSHYLLKEYISQEKFSYFKEVALSLGFKSVMSTPYTRSSYLAHLYFDSSFI